MDAFNNGTFLVDDSAVASLLNAITGQQWLRIEYVQDVDACGTLDDYSPEQWLYSLPTLLGEHQLQPTPNNFWA